MKRPLGRVEQVGRVALLLPGQGGGGRGPARVAARASSTTTWMGRLRTSTPSSRTVPAM